MKYQPQQQQGQTPERNQTKSWTHALHDFLCLSCPVWFCRCPGAGAYGRDLPCTPLGCDYLAVLTWFEIITRNSCRPRKARGRMSNLLYLQDPGQVSSLTVYVYNSPLKLVAASKAVKLRTVCSYVWVGAVSTHKERLFLVYCSSAPVSRAGNRLFCVNGCSWVVVARESCVW